ncbi:hypothetical protein FDE76_15170 [Clostridium botulinum]|uniref:Uncharacterized protein n=2 Tax=Clostridium botulinum TaxID=1491 RepID=A0A0A0UTC3_CLOBO|nr:hypothetical protein [Clostridium botulinum]ACD14166.1 hypothetical protein CLL_0028 [Clostridium botulinum B str. Eklund 17B (NRP)]AIW54513.1 hypothetical protein [Clostridium botulinum]AIW54567.1 hypothetical protein [Clostridium botulinum]ALP69013.1 hypothetical protein [Clostridium botulinum]MBY6977862.1 hypothetical protein [Clostridium botulinum]
MNKIIRVKVSKEIRNIIDLLSREKNKSKSQMLREILKIYKENNTTRNKNEVEDYSIIIHIPEKEGFTKEKYQKYADKITNDDIMIIINDLYNIQA